jgi:hypothetical protein
MVAFFSYVVRSTKISQHTIGHRSLKSYLSMLNLCSQDDTTLVLYALQGMFWKDPRLTWTGEPKKISLPSSVVWTPDIAPLNEYV